MKRAKLNVVLGALTAAVVLLAPNVVEGKALTKKSPTIGAMHPQTVAVVATELTAMKVEKAVVLAPTDAKAAGTYAQMTPEAVDNETPGGALNLTVLAAGYANNSAAKLDHLAPAIVPLC